jgi:hypothetical protein
MGHYERCMRMSVWDEMNNADPGGKGQYFENGDYICKISRCSARSGHKGLSAIVEFEVIASTGVGAASPGSHRSFVRNCSKPESLKMAMGDLLALLLAVCNVDDRTAYAKETFRPRAGALWDRAIGVANPLAEKLVAVSVFTTKTKTGNDFSIHRFGPVVPGVSASPDYRFPSCDEIMAAPAASTTPAAQPPPLTAPQGYPPGFPAGAPPGYAPPGFGPPPATAPPNPAKALAQITPGWTRPDGSWWNGSAWANG